MKEYLKCEVNASDPDLISVIDELPLWSAPFGLRLLETVDLKKNLSVLDLGCGLGFPLIDLSQRLGESSTIYGIDAWNEALDRIRQKIKVYDINNVKIFNVSAEKMPFENEFFDLIVSNNGINNVRDLQQTLKECWRVCKSNSQLVFTLNTEDTMKEFYSVYQQVLKEENLGNEILKMREQIHSKRKPVKEIKSLVTTSGFEIREVINDSFELSFIDGTTMFNHYLIKYWFLDGWKNILVENDLERIFHKVETRLNKEADNHGKLVLTIPFVTFNCNRN